MICKKNIQKSSNFNIDWAQEPRYNELRNILVHSEGARSFQKSNQPLRSFLAAIPGVVLSEEGEQKLLGFQTNKIIFLFYQCGARIYLSKM